MNLDEKKLDIYGEKESASLCGLIEFKGGLWRPWQRYALY